MTFTRRYPEIYLECASTIQFFENKSNLENLSAELTSKRPANFRLITSEFVR
jgi:hypothetical protein